MVTDLTAKRRKDRAKYRDRARALRHAETNAERKFWWHIRNRQLNGLKFRRQVPIGSYIADFVCLEKKLVVELDGDAHATAVDYDRRRDAFLRAKGFRVVRVWNVDVMTNLDGVIEGLLAALNAPTPSPNPLPLRGRGKPER